MKTYFDRTFNQWCTEDYTGTIITAAWGDTPEESLVRYNEIKNSRI